MVLSVRMVSSVNVDTVVSKGHSCNSVNEVIFNSVLRGHLKEWEERRDRQTDAKAPMTYSSPPLNSEEHLTIL
jgi:hypothetical protein